MLGSLVGSFAAAEGAIRIWEAWRPAPERNPSGSNETTIIPDPDLGYRLRPNFGMHNADGLNGPPAGPKSDRFRVLVLGDSLIYGRNNVVSRTAEILAADADLKPAEFLNAGVPGYTNYQELIYLKQRGLAFQPDLVGVVFVLNDLHKFLHNPRFEGAAEGFDNRSEAALRSDRSLLGMARRSRFLVWLRRNFKTSENFVRMVEERGYTFDYNPDFQTAWKEEPWSAIEAQLGEMAGLGRSSRFGLFLVAMPYGEQFRKDYLARDYAYVTKPQRHLEQICRRLGIAYLDLFPALDPQRHMARDRVHLTPAGRAVVAERTAAFLKSERLIPARAGGTGKP